MLQAGSVGYRLSWCCRQGQLVTDCLGAAGRVSWLHTVLMLQAGSVGYRLSWCCRRGQLVTYNLGKVGLYLLSVLVLRLISVAHSRSTVLDCLKDVCACVRVLHVVVDFA